MATTNNGKPHTGNGQNHTSSTLRPLNVGAKRARRTSEQAREARIQREKQLADKAAKRAAKLAEQQQRAQERAEAALKRAEEIRMESERKERERQEQERRDAEQRQHIVAESKPEQANQNGVVPKANGNGDISTDTLNKIGSEFKRFYDYLGEKYGIEFTGTSPNLVKRGFISMKLRGILGPLRREINTASPTGVAREAVRFMQFHKEVGLTPDMLNKQIKLKDDPNTYEVSGLRGKSHLVVIRKVDTKQAFTMSAEDFKKSLEQ